MTASTAQQMRDWKGPAILSFGFRPFFLLAGIWAVLAMGIWIAMLAGHPLPTAFDPVSWHAHELLFGYLGAVMAGFLMTAVPNWTGRMPIVGWPLAGLVAIWIAGRGAVAFSVFAPTSAAVIDLAFPLVLALAMGREIVAGRNWRNLAVLWLLGVFILANALFHFSALRGGFPAHGIGLRLGLGVAILLIALIGGRIVPSFTTNWLKQQGSAARPVPFNRADKGVLLTGAAAVLLWVFAPDLILTGFALMIAGVAHLWRQSRWGGRHTISEPLLWVLHAGYGFVPIGFLLLGGAIFWGMAPATAQHVWMAGAVGLMTLAVMTRASLGHAGRPLRADRATTLIYLALIGSVVARLAYGLAPQMSWLLHLAAGLWIAAFGGFAIAYWAVLVRPKQARKRVS